MGKATAFLIFNVSELLGKPRNIVRIVIALSGLIVFSEFYDMYLYMPSPRGLLKALQNAVLGHSGLWLATLRIRGHNRFLIAALMWPSMAVVFLFYWGISHFLSFAIAIAMLWLFVRVVRGEGFENRSVQ